MPLHFNMGEGYKIAVWNVLTVIAFKSYCSIYLYNISFVDRDEQRTLMGLNQQNFYIQFLSTIWLWEYHANEVKGTQKAINNKLLYLKVPYCHGFLYMNLCLQFQQTLCTSLWFTGATSLINDLLPSGYFSLDKEKKKKKSCLAMWLYLILQDCLKNENELKCDHANSELLLVLLHNYM